MMLKKITFALALRIAPSARPQTYADNWQGYAFTVPQLPDHPLVVAKRPKWDEETEKMIPKENGWAVFLLNTGYAFPLPTASRTRLGAMERMFAVLPDVPPERVDRHIATRTLKRAEALLSA